MVLQSLEFWSMVLLSLVEHLATARPRWSFEVTTTLFLTHEQLGGLFS